MRDRILRLLAAALALVLAVTLLPLGALAVDTERDCYIRVAPGSEELMDDLAGADLTLDLYRIGSAQPVEKDEVFSFKAEGVFAGIEDIDDLLADPKGTVSDWEVLAQSCLELVSKNAGLKPTEIIAADPKTGITSSKALKPGLYLLLEHGTDLTDKADYIKSVPAGEDDAGEMLVTIAKTENYEYRYAPQLLSLPTSSETAEGLNYGTEDKPVSVVLKASRVNQYGSLKIVKTLTVMELEEGQSFEPATFVFEITGTMPDGKTGYSSVAAISFSDPSKLTDSVTIDKLPIGMQVTVREVYSGSHYKSADGKKVAEWTGVITADTPDGSGQAVAPFENTYENTGRRGHGITNNFVYGTKKGETRPDWIWTPIPADAQESGTQTNGGNE